MLFQHILIPILTRFLSHLIEYGRLFAVIISINVKFDELEFLDFVVTVLGVVCGGEYSRVFGMDFVYYHAIEACAE
jgi:hypothetical protein